MLVNNNKWPQEFCKHPVYAFYLYAETNENETWYKHALHHYCNQQQYLHVNNNK